MIPYDSTKIFTEVFPDADTFLTEWKECPLYSNGLVKDTSITSLYYLIYSRHGNSAIANWDENQFKFKVWSIIYQYAPTWERELSIQETLRGLSETDISTGTKMIHNHAYNPSTDPSTGSLTELTSINEQNTSNTKRGKLEGYATLVSLLDTNITSTFLDRFKPLFAKFIRTKPILYCSEEEEL